MTQRMVLGWRPSQWTLALVFYQQPCTRIDDFVACRRHWYAHWRNPPSTTQLWFTPVERQYLESARLLFRLAAANLRGEGGSDGDPPPAGPPPDTPA